MTNGDWIRKMSDRELAEFLTMQDPCKGRSCTIMKESGCANCLEVWLSEEHKEDTHA